ncbi:MAG TPA: hypothetical protein VIY30_00215 [Burkholderiaceae bacterium]
MQIIKPAAAGRSPSGGPLESDLVLGPLRHDEKAHMRRLLATLVLTTMAIGLAMAQPQAAAPAPPAAPAASAASAPRPSDKPLLAPMKMPQPEAPAVQRSKEATIPGDLRPERQNVPQLNLKFGKGSPGAGPTTGGIDDSVARCRAKRTSEEREACEAGLDNI